MNSSQIVLLVALLSGFLTREAAMSRTLLVPADFLTIQQAIDSSSDADTVLVSPGTYTENIIYRGKNVVVTGRYLVDHDYQLIFSTIIDGSTPADPDSASCVRFMHGEDTGAVIEGFTLTGGTGTVHPDEDPTYIWREGGGVFAYYSSPTIKNNYITGNSSEEAAGLTGAGGGGVALFKSHNPYLINNVITFNTGNHYAPGVSVDKSGAIVRNNIIARNSGANTYGGGGIWVLEEGSYPVFIENNTVVWNESEQKGAGLFVWNGEVTATNNIFWGNEFTEQVFLKSGSLEVSFSVIENGYSAGVDVVMTDPLFENNSLYLSHTSSAIDAGSNSEEFNDLENPESTGSALPPSAGTTRNDAGAFGGPDPLQFSIDIEPLVIPQPSGLNQLRNAEETSFDIVNLSESIILHYRGVQPQSPIEVYTLLGVAVAAYPAVSSAGTITISGNTLRRGNYIITAAGYHGRHTKLTRL
jgi:hypothetical protein